MDSRQPVNKRRKLLPSSAPSSTAERSDLAAPLTLLHRDITPPLLRGEALLGRPSALKVHERQILDGSDTEDEDEDGELTAPNPRGSLVAEGSDTEDEDSVFPASASRSSAEVQISSPVQLTRIRDLPDSANVDAVTLNDLLGHPLIKECWQFNFMFDLDFVMNAFDVDIKNLVKVNIVHGSWKSEDSNRIRLVQAAQRYPNVKLITAHMPEAFGTHHSKMMVLFRHDDVAQIVIHTANMIARDWTNMCQAVWRSPLLPLLAHPKKEESVGDGAIGSGYRFQSDFFRYLKAYETRTRSLVDQLKMFDFRGVKAALIASVPCRTRLDSSSHLTQTSFGWPGLNDIFKHIPIPQTNSKQSASIIIQTSSIATLTEKWLANFLNTLAGPNSQTSSSQHLFAKKATATAGAAAANDTKKTRFNIIFPTANEIRDSLDGYASGVAIHTKIHSPAQIKQLALLRPMLCHWSSDPPPSTSTSTYTSKSSSSAHQNPRSPKRREALRRRAAPHIKTYIRFHDDDDAAQREIAWALVTSANLSQQAWGALPDANGHVRICSYEIGVVIWPALWDEEFLKMRMVPTFAKDLPELELQLELEAKPELESELELESKTELELGVVDGAGKKSVKRNGEGNNSSVMRGVVGFRMPYDLPLVSYGQEEVPWCASASHAELDWKGDIYMLTM